MRAKNEDTKIRIYEYINEYIKTYRVSPTITEIAKNANCAVSTAYKFLERLQDEGLIDMAGRGRITSTVNNWEMGYAPILGMVACGKPKLAVEDIQGYLPLNMDYFGKGEYFLLVASGESMINAGMTKANQYAIDNGIKFNEEETSAKIDELVALCKVVNVNTTREKNQKSQNIKTDDTSCLIDDKSFYRQKNIIE